ncbi:MAG TPA: glutaminase, partial [Noviherbaspirillum sp.]
MSLKTSVAAARPRISSPTTSSTAGDESAVVPAAASPRAESEKPICHLGSGRMRAALLKVADKLKPEHGPKTYVTSALLDKAHQQAEQPAGKFFPAGYIPALKNYPKGKTGSAVANPFTGEVIAARDSTMTVTAQSTTKLYMAALLMMLEGPKGENELFRTVGKQPSDEAFNADSRIPDKAQSHKPLNTYINIGAMAVTNRTWELLTERDRQLAEQGKPVPEGGSRPEIVLRDLLRTLTGNDGIEVDHEVAESERETGDNNRRLLGNVARERQTPVDGQPRLDGKGRPYPEMDQERIDESAANYFRQCALKMSPQDHAKALWGLEHKINPETGKKYLTADQLAILKDLTDLAGNYDQSAELAKKTKGGAIAK